MTRQLFSFLARRVFSRLVAAMLCFGAGVPAWAQFETRAIQPAGPHSGAFSIAAGDFNNDGKLDVAVYVGGGFTVSLGNGDGTFRKPVFYATELAISLAAADFNNDGNLDIVVANADQSPNTVSVYLGNGDGTFRAPIKSNTTNSNEFVAVGDFNGDGKADVVVIDSPSISVLLGNGDGTFQPPSDNDSFLGAQWLAVGDFNNDHRLDVVVDGSFGTGANIGVLLGNGNGTLRASLTYPLEYFPESIAVGDFSRDGYLDAVVGDKYGAITLLLGNGDGSFQPAVTYPTTGLGGNQAVVADLNLDGKLDIVLPNSVGSSLAPSTVGVDVFWGNGDGTFGPPQFFACGEAGLIGVGDLNGDGLPDLALANDLVMISMLNTGVASFSSSAPLIFPVQLINTSSPRQTLTLTDNGLAALSITSMKVSGEFEISNTCGSSVVPGASCRISVAFHPKSAGMKSGSITLVDNASSRPQVVELSALATAVKLSAASLRFSDQKVGTKSKAQTISVTNEGATAIAFSSFNILGDFSETNTCLSGNLAPGGSCSVAVIFAPTKSGPRTGTLYINVRGGFSPPHVGLSGIGD